MKEAVPEEAVDVSVEAVEEYEHLFLLLMPVPLTQMVDSCRVE